MTIPEYNEDSQFLVKLGTNGFASSSPPPLPTLAATRLSASATLVDPATGKSKFASLKTPSAYYSVFPVPTNTMGGWTLTLDLVPKGTTKYSTGTGTILTSAGNSATFTATAAYTTKTDASTILLTGTGASKGSSLALKASTTGTNLNIETFSGSLFGQTIEFKSLAPPVF